MVDNCGVLWDFTWKMIPLVALAYADDSNNIQIKADYVP